MVEVTAWKNIPMERIKQFIDESGLVDELKLAFSLREELPLHHALAKQVHSHLAHEANAEETFSLSGKLSDARTRTGGATPASSSGGRASIRTAVCTTQTRRWC